MAKLKNGLIKEVKEQRKYQEQQKLLKKKYHINEDVTIVEKSNILQFAVNMFIRLFHFSVNALLYFLALVGSAGLVYPESRTVLMQLFRDIIKQIIYYI